MRLVDGSDPTAVLHAKALELINERLVLANAVCAELDACQGNYAGSLPAAALTLLLAWVAARYEKNVETRPSDGLDQMLVPPDAEDRMAELRVATAVCEALSMLWTADRRSEFNSDSNDITESLNCWRSRRSGDPTRWQRPVPEHEAISLPENGRRLSPTELAYKKKASAVRQARLWNKQLADNPTYGPSSGYEVGVVDEPVNGEWPLTWVHKTPEDVGTGLLEVLGDPG